MKRSTLFSLLILCLMTVMVAGQDNRDINPAQYTDQPAQYILGNNDVLLISVNLWGHVLKPGIYSVPSSFGIVDLLSSAGGPLKSARLNDVRIIRKNQEVITVNIEEFIKTGNQSLLVNLQPGDVIVVSGSISDIFGRIVGFMRDMAIIVNVILLASRL
ncbi:MAG: polysaccharide biosynthesis/export family protein [Calditrichia bacterium]